MLDQIERMPIPGRWRVVLKNNATGEITAIIENLLENEVFDLYLDILDDEEYICQ